MHFLFLFYSKFIFSKTTYEELKLLAYEKRIENISVLQTVVLKVTFLKKSKNHYIKHETRCVIQFFFFFPSFNKHSLVKLLGNVLTRVWQVNMEVFHSVYFLQNVSLRKEFYVFYSTWFNRKEWYEKGKKKNSSVEKYRYMFFEKVLYVKID